MRKRIRLVAGDAAIGEILQMIREDAGDGAEIQVSGSHGRAICQRHNSQPAAPCRFSSSQPKPILTHHA